MKAAILDKKSVLAVLLALLIVCLALFAFSGCSDRTPAATPSPTFAPSPDLTPEPPPTAPIDTTPSPPPPPTPTPDVVETPEPTTSLPSGLDTSIDTSSPAYLQETEDMGQEYIDKIIFLGDSTTYGLKYYEMLTGGFDTKQVWTPASGTLTLSYQSVATIVYPEDGSEITIVEAATRAQPEMMVITLGVNGVSFMDEFEFKREYKDLVESIREVSPDTKIILQSIFPVASTYGYLNSINNVKIMNANRWILAVAEETGAAYLHTVSVLLGEDGWLPAEYHNGDGIHLNPDSFAIVLNYIRTHGYK